METVTNRDYPVYRGLFRLLNYNELFNGVITNEPDMGMSIKILHFINPKEMISALYFKLVTGF